MRILILSMLLVLAGLGTGTGAEFESINPEAEKLYAEGSYARARELYAKIDRAKLTPAEKRWIEFRLADTLWRAVGSENADDEESQAAVEPAQKALQALIHGRERVEEQDRVWAEAQESLGRLLALAMNHPMPLHRRIVPAQEEPGRAAWEHLEKAFGWWARSRDVELARKRYLDLAWWVTDAESNVSDRNEGNVILENAVKIAVENSDRARAHLLLARRLWIRQIPNEVYRVAGEFEKAIADGKGTKWHDDALFQYGEWLSQSGKLAWDDRGEPSIHPNQKKAVEIFRKIVSEYPGNHEYVRQASERLRGLEASSLDILVSSIIPPGAEAKVDLHFRNVREVEFTLRKIDLFKDFQARPQQRMARRSASQFGENPGEVVKKWKRDLSNFEEYANHSEQVAIEGKLSAGAYVIEASANGKFSAQDLIVTDIAAVTKSASDRTIVYVCHAETGAPVEKAQVKLVEMFWRGREISSRTRDGETDASGLIEFMTDAGPRHSGVVLALSDGRPAIAQMIPIFMPSQESALSWKLFGVTDRPAYRPNETLHWKVTARVTEKDVYKTPQGERLQFTIQDARGQKLKDGEVTLNAFGSAWGECELPADAALGAWMILFTREKQNPIGAIQFRVEEYKLPEFKVAVETPKEIGRPKLFRLGDKIEINVKGEYYFGGPVANASVHVIVRTNGIYHFYHWPKPYGWLLGEASPRIWLGYSHGQTAFEKDLTTDSEGNARLTVDTSTFGTEDIEISVEARVTDLSRREVVGNGKVRVTKLRYQVFARAEHLLFRPGDKAVVLFKAQDANERGVEAEGKVVVTRERWREKTDNYEKESIATADVKTDAKGEATFSFTPKEDGYYRITWLGKDGEDGPPIRAEASIWVGTSASVHLGYRHGGLEIVVDKDTFHSGQKAAVMLNTPSTNRYVLLTVGTDRVFRRELIHMTGTTKLLEVDIGEEHVPNFWIDAVMVSDFEMFADTKEVAVPPVKQFLQVEVKPERDEYRIREEAAFVITTKNYEGKPVQAELSLGVIDESIYYIQEDYAPDIRQFFYGTRRFQRAYTSSSLQGEARPKYPASKAPMMIKGAADSARFDSMNVAAAGSASAPEPVVRTDFRSTLVWQPDVKTDADGTARVKARFPDSVTTWDAAVRAATAGNHFGEARATTKTTQPVIVRLQAPRFFVAGDTVTISAVINNNGKEPITTKPEILVKGLALNSNAAGEISVPAGGEKRVDWVVKAEQAGAATIRVAGGGDAMERVIPVYEHGIEKFTSESGKFNAREVRMKLQLPPRKKESTKVVVQVTPSLAVTMLDALPYLLDYPYGCTEQTISRFLPAAIVAKTLQDVGIDAETAMGRVFGGIDNPKAPKNNLGKLQEITQAGLKRLQELQHSDGGWGWWEGGASDPWMTAYAIWALSIGIEAQLDIPPHLVESGANFLKTRLAEVNKNPELQAWMLHALAAARKDKPDETERAAIENLWRQRDTLNSYSRALFALAVDEEEAAALLRTLDNGVRRDGDTAHWGSSGSWWRWSDSPVESTAFALRALLASDSKNKLVEPAAMWLIKNRRGAQWSNTRDTAITLLALCDYLKASGQLQANGEFSVTINGSTIATRKFSQADILNAPSRFVIDPKHLRDGANDVRIVRKIGDSPLYYAVEATYFTLEEPVKPAGNEIAARREYHRLVAHPTLLEGNEYERIPLKDGDRIASGDRLQVSIIIESKNDYEYLLFEDLKPGGFEAAQIRSGEGAQIRQIKAAAARRGGILAEEDYAQGSRWIYQEFRDRKVASFIDQLPQGFWELRYELRAETPGAFHALPASGHAMYVPEIRCNSSEARVEIISR